MNWKHWTIVWLAVGALTLDYKAFADECPDWFALPLIDAPFVPAPQGPDRLIGIGMLRELRGTN